ncbi:MAG: carboxylate--amine ligase [Eubacteriales bacterium]
MKFLVLGAGSCQLNLIKYLKSNNHEVIVTDYLKDSIGKKYADKSEMVSTFDLEGIVSIAKKHKVDTILTAGTDQPVYYAAKACEILNLPNYISSNLALLVTDKKRMKEIFDKNNIPTVKYVLLKENENIDLIDNDLFPGVVKPLDSQGQRGVLYIKDKDDLKKKINIPFSFTKQSEILLEKYYENDEITISGWIIEKDTKVLSISDRVTYNNFPHIGICISHNYPSKHYKEYSEEIIKITKDIVSGFKIEKGPIYFQMLIGSEGIKVNEIACRIGGAFEDVYIPYVSGVNMSDLLLRDSSNIPHIQKVKSNSISKKTKISVQLFFARPGKISYMSSLDSLVSNGLILDGRFNFKVGDNIPKIKNATQRAGHFIVSSSNKDNLFEKVDKVFNKVKILDEDGNNLVIPYKFYDQI